MQRHQICSFGAHDQYSRGDDCREIGGIFSFTGIPKILRSDNAGAFKSEVMSAMRHKLGIEAKYSAPFHFMSHGSVERVQRTIESILRKLLMENREWDKILPYIAFALRETPHSSTGYSPAELVFGHQFRGLLEVVRETWISGDPIREYKKLSTAQYIQQLRERIDNALEAAHVNTDKAQRRMKANYDKRATVRELQPDDFALILLPTCGNKLLATWSGPYRVLRKRENGNYELLVGKRKALYHINSLRKYNVDNDQHDKQCMMIVSDELDQSQDADELGMPQIVPDWSDGDNAEFIIGQQLSADQREAMRALLNSYPDVFTNQPGRTDLITHHIELTDDTPCYQPPYKIPETMKDEVERELSTVLELGIIKYDEHTKWNSPLVIVKKPHGIRLVNNFIELNKKTVDEPYPMNDPSELISRVAGARFVTRIDLFKAFWQIPLSEESQKYTGFQTHCGKYSYKNLPMGLKCASFTCQRLLDRVLRGTHRYTGTLIDDILIFSKEFGLHLEHVREVLNRLRAAGLTVNTRKCTFASNNIKIFGHTVNDGLISPDEQKVEVVANWPIPKTKKQLRSYIGFVNYFRSYIPNYSSIAFPLTEMLTKKKSDKLQWSDEAQEAFDRLKNALISKPVLRSPDMTKDYILMTDSSKYSLGCVLLQPDDDENSPGHVIAFASRKLLPRERKYATVEQELMAIVFGLTKFYQYIYNRPVKVYTDHRPLQWLNSLTKHSSRLAR